MPKIDSSIKPEPGNRFQPLGAPLNSVNSGGQSGFPTVTLSNSSATTAAAVGDTIGTIQGPSTSGYTLTNNASGKFSLAGLALKVAGTLLAGVSAIAISAVDASGWSRTFNFNITITDAGSGGGAADPNRYMFASTRLTLPTRLSVPGPSQVSRLSHAQFVSPDYTVYDPFFVYQWVWYDNGGSVSNPWPENDPGNSGTIDFSTLFLSGTPIQNKFGGQNSYTIPDGGVVLTDPLIGTSIPPRTSLFIRTSDTVAVDQVRPGGIDSQQQNGEGVELTSAPQTGKATSGTVGTSNTGSSGSNGNGVTIKNNGLLYAPVMMCGKGWDGRAVVMILGDSLAAPAIDVGRWAPASGVTGWIARGLDSNANGTQRLPHCNMAITGSGPAGMSSRNAGAYRRRGQMFDAIAAVNGGKMPFNTIVSEHLINGANAVMSGTALLALMQTYLDFLRSEYPEAKILQTQTMTSMYSSNQFLDTAGQYPRTADSTYPALTASDSTGSRYYASNWFATKPPPIDDYIDLQSYFDSPPGYMKPRTFAAQLTASCGVGASTLQMDTAPTIGELLTLEPGTGNADTVTGATPQTLSLLYVASVSGTGPYTVTVTPGTTSKAHSVGAAVRASPSPDFVHKSPLQHIEGAQAIIDAKVAGKFGAAGSGSTGGGGTGGTGGGGGSSAILATGTWNDAGVWDDTATWKDS